MPSYCLTPAAEDDLFDIWSYIAPDNFPAANRLESQILAACQRLANKPDLGHWRRDLTDKPVRFFTVKKNYMIVYDPATQPLEVIRILHASRDVASELQA